MQSGLSIVPLIVGEGAVTASRAITAADKGKILSISAPSAGIVLTLDTAATLGNGFYSFIRRRDTNVNAVHVTASWAETVDGLASFHVCQEDFILRSNSTALLR